jgi:hypothetical protein
MVMGFYQDRKIEAQKARIAELEVLLSQTNEGYAECIATREDYRARIAELEKMLAVHRLAVDVDALKARIAELKEAMLRIGQPGKQIVYCRDGHEETVLLARAALEKK